MAYRTTPKMAQRKDARRRQLVEIATRLFGARGYHATTVPEIVAESGSSTGAFYFYFHNKEDVFAAVLEALGDRISTELNQAIAEAGCDVLGQMRAAVERMFLFLAENPEQARILIVESSGLGERLEGIRRNVVRSHTQSVESALTALAQVLPIRDPQVAARCWVGAVYEAVFSWLELPAEQRPEARQVASVVADFNLRAIGVRDRRWLSLRNVRP